MYWRRVKNDLSKLRSRRPNRGAVLYGYNVMSPLKLYLWYLVCETRIQIAYPIDQGFFENENQRMPRHLTVCGSCSLAGLFDIMAVWCLVEGLESDAGKQSR